MKILHIAIVPFLLCSQLHAQNLVKSEKFKISFESTEILESYETRSDSKLGYDNDDYAVDIEIVPIEEESKGFINDIKYGAREIAIDMGLKNIVNGSKIPTIKESYYVLAYDNEDNIKTPVYIIAILNYDRKIAYEITIYCYNLDSIEGEKIAKSFRLIK